MGALAFAGGLVGTVFVSPLLANATPQAENPYAATLQLGRVLVQVENNYVEPVERTRLVNGAIAGMVEQLDPHSSYLPPQEFTAFQDDTEGKFGGVGIEVDVRSDAITVLAPIEGTPAERAGIRSGDRIVGIDGEQVLSSSLDTMIKRMRGKPGTHIKFTVRREGVKELLSFDLVREVIHVSSVTSRLLDGNIAYLRIKQFQDRTHEELLRAASNVRTRLAETVASHPGKKAPPSVAGVLLDLRSNPGGLVDEAAEVADEFLSNGGIYTTRHRGKTIDDVRARGGGAFSDVPVVILVNEWSASASELVAGALQDNRRAIVVGANTFGKGSVQSIIELPGGAGLRLTTARYYTPGGRSIQAEGIHPDVLLAAKSNDPNALRAVHERDLEGHLAGEMRKTTTAANAPAARMAPDGGSLEPMETRDIPSDPTKSKDFVLRTGYEVLRDKLAGKGPIVPSAK